MYFFTFTYILFYIFGWIGWFGWLLEFVGDGKSEIFKTWVVIQNI